MISIKHSTKTMDKKGGAIRSCVVCTYLGAKLAGAAGAGAPVVFLVS